MLEHHASQHMLGLISKKIPIKFCEYSISVTEPKMFTSECTAISKEAILFESDVELKRRTLLRVLVQIPNYWARKSRLVEYQQTEIPTAFQLFGRILIVEPKIDTNTYTILCQNLSLDAIDERLLLEYLDTAS